MPIEDQRASSHRRIRGLAPEERREQRRQAILEASAGLFAERGYLGTSIEQICQSAFVSTKSFYEVFASREDCYKALYASSVDEMKAELLAVSQLRSQDEADFHKTLTSAFIEVVFRDPVRAKVFWGVQRAVTPDIESMRRDTRVFAAGLVADVWAFYGAPRDELDVLALAFMGGVFDLLTAFLLEHDPTDEEAVASLAHQVQRFYVVMRAGLG